MYCIKCGVKLADTERKCPLCGTVVYHPELEQAPRQPLYPSGKMPRIGSGRKTIGGVIIILYLVPLILSLFSDLQWDRTLDWFGYVAGGLVASYVTFALPLWFKKPNPVVFVPCAFAATILYLLYINLATDGDWFLLFALPVGGGACLLVSALVALLRYVKRGRLYIFGGAFMLLGGLILLIEYLLNLTFDIEFIGWSVYPLLVLVLLGGLLIYLAINSTAREMMERKLFF